MSGGTAPGYAGMGAYGPMAAGAAAGGAAGYYGATGTDGSHSYYESVPAGLSDNAYSMAHDNGYSQATHEDPYYAASGAPQLNWAPGASPPLDHDYAAAAGGAGGAGNVFADPSSSSNETDGRIDMRAHEAGSSVSLRTTRIMVGGWPFAMASSKDEKKGLGMTRFVGHPFNLFAYSVTYVLLRLEWTLALHCLTPGCDGRPLALGCHSRHLPSVLVEDLLGCE